MTRKIWGPSDSRVFLSRSSCIEGQVFATDAEERKKIVMFPHGTASAVQRHGGEAEWEYSGTFSVIHRCIGH